MLNAEKTTLFGDFSLHFDAKWLISHPNLSPWNDFHSGVMANYTTTIV
jgi:hypothetical protein